MKKLASNGKAKRNGKRLPEVAKLQVVTFRLNAKEQRRLRDFARKMKRTPSEVIRFMVGSLPAPAAVASTGGVIAFHMPPTA